MAPALATPFSSSRPCTNPCGRSVSGQSTRVQSAPQLTLGPAPLCKHNMLPKCFLSHCGVQATCNSGGTTIKWCATFKPPVHNCVKPLYGGGVRQMGGRLVFTKDNCHIHTPYLQP